MWQPGPGLRTLKAKAKLSGYRFWVNTGDTSSRVNNWFISQILVTWDSGMSILCSVMVKNVTGHIFVSQICFSSNFQDGKSGPHRWQRRCLPRALKTWSETVSDTAQSPWTGHSTFSMAGNQDVLCCRGFKVCHGETDHAWQRCRQPYFESHHLSKSQ